MPEELDFDVVDVVAPEVVELAGAGADDDDDGVDDDDDELLPLPQPATASASATSAAPANWRYLNLTILICKSSVLRGCRCIPCTH
jgi:hypothetical protein